MELDETRAYYTYSEVSQKEKHQYSILMHTYGIYKDSNKDPIWKIANDMQI